MNLVCKNRMYRHFKGGYYYVEDIAVDTETGKETVVYRSISDGTLYCREIKDFTEEVLSREDNVTRQKYRFELVENLSNFLSDVSTQGLMDELFSRKDNPLLDFDLDKLNDGVAFRRYLMCTECGEIIEPVFTADSKEELIQYIRHNLHRVGGSTKFYKEVFIPLEILPKDL